MPEDLKIDRRTLLKTAVSAGAAAAAPAVLAADANAVRWSEVHDVVIAGAGGAGLAAAVMAGSISKDVVVLEKTQDVGGNTRLADAFNAVDPAVQKPLGIEDSPELHARQMLETGRWCADPKLVETVATGAPRALAWLKELGVRFEPGVYQVYGSLWPRTHSPSEPEGSGYIRPLLFKCRELGVSIRTGTKVLRVIRNGLEGPVLGVEAERMNGRRLFIRARRGVVVATGGFGANAELVGRRAVVLMHRIARRPFYGAKVTMCVNCTLGGIAITPRAEVLDRHGRVIPRLYAAGEVTGGVHGANYMGGNALSDVFTFGRIAGENAVQEPFA